MAVKTKVMVNLKDSEALVKELFNRSFSRKLAETIITEIKDFTSKGLSPVEGQGRFDAYALQRDNDKRKYPYPHTNSGKNIRPVNLRLSGELMEALSFTEVKDGVLIGILPQAKDEIKKRAEAHNEGTLENRNVPQRRFIPTKRDEKFVVSIERKIKALFEMQVKEIIKKMNNKGG